MSLLEIKNVSKTYESGSVLHPRKIKAVNDVSLSVQEGECFALVGESGSGKSTLGRMAVGLETCDAGEILFAEHKLNARHMNRADRQALQMVYQNSFEATNPGFTAAQVVEEPVRYFHLASGDKRREKIVSCLNKVGIPEGEMNRKAHEFSGGQLQRICIARALAADPKLILLDEPLSSLDVSVQAQILNLLKRLKEQEHLTYLLISHDLEVVYFLADRLAVMYHGQIVEEIDHMELFSSLCHPYTLLLMGKENGLSSDGGTEAENPGESGCVFADKCPHACDRCRKERPVHSKKEEGHVVACFREG